MNTPVIRLTASGSSWSTCSPATARAARPCCSKCCTTRKASSAAGCPSRPCAASATYLHVPLAEIYGVTEFYDMFHTEPVGRKHIRVCVDGPCAVRGSDALMAEVSRRTGVRPARRPRTARSRSNRSAAWAVRPRRRRPWSTASATRPPQPTTCSTGRPRRRSSRSAGWSRWRWRTSASSIRPAWPTTARRAAWPRCARSCAEMTPAQVIAQVKASKLVGRGGAAFSAGLKWELAARHPRPTYVICNADESEPGAFKDRVLMDGDPFRVIEGLLIACYAIGAEHAFIYVRGEHRLGYERFSEAVRQLDEAGYLCGDDPRRGPFACRIEVRRGAGAYVCGEETALMESIEGKRGFPRLRPPYPTDSGPVGPAHGDQQRGDAGQGPLDHHARAGLVQRAGHQRVGRHQALRGQRLGGPARRVRDAVRHAAAPPGLRPGGRAGRGAHASRAC